jgi:pimeloyl-ACP methyl ester carboxylesterase
MPAVFVHGVPDTHRVWAQVTSRLARRDVIAVSLPGFGRPLPDGFRPSKEGYVEWLLGELAGIPGPIDLVGHDWGALLVVRAVSVQPAIARSWAAGAAPLDSEYQWHRAASLWQTPGVGEEVMARTPPAAMRTALAAAGVPEADAARAAEHLDDTMKRAILALYRSAVTVGSEWEGELGRIRARGLVLWGDADPYAAARFGERLAEKTGARFVSLAGCGHWWQLERPDAVAAELEKLWAESS